jgi:hypothetical protein
VAQEMAKSSVFRGVGNFRLWAVRALFGQTSERAQTLLTVVVAAAVAWPILLFGVVAPKLAAVVFASLPIPDRISDWTIRIVWIGLALLIPIGVGISVATRARTTSRRESLAVKVLRGFPITVGLSAAFLIMIVSVPVMRLAAIMRRRKTVAIPLMTDEAAYRDVALNICTVLNRHKFSFRRSVPRWWVTAPTHILTWLGGDVLRSFLPSRVEHFVSGDIEMSLYPSGLLLRGKAGRLAWAHSLIAESVVHTEGLQAVDPNAQNLERRLRRLWKTCGESPGAGESLPDLVPDLEQITRDLGGLEVDFDDWQILYRQVLQVGRSIHGLPQLMDAEMSRR